jgi:hypothetical protein
MRLGAGFFQHSRNVAQCEFGLRGEIIALECLLRIPADLAGDEHLATSCGNAIGIALGRRPTVWLQKLMRHVPPPVVASARSR